MGASLCEAVSPSHSRSTGDNTSAGVLCPVCAEEIKGAGKRGGAVGCLNGHAIHAACAADLALGGGVCPTCRAPLYYAQVLKAEVAAARLLAKDLAKDLEEADDKSRS